MPTAQAMGAYYQSRASSQIKTRGQQLVVERWPSGARTPTLSQTLWCIPIADEAAAQALFAEGDLNALNSQPYEFHFEGTVDVRETVDKVIYRGWRYILTAVVPSGDHNGVVISLIVKGIRDGQVES